MAVFKATTEAYRTRYAGLDFERSGLFECIRENFSVREVLYPGCSVHITPAFSFPNVVFVDSNPAVEAFFSNREPLLDLIKRNRRYRKNPRIRFLGRDFRQPLPVRTGQFGLLLALFTGGVAKSCAAYLAEGGLLVTNNHRGDAADAARMGVLSPIGVIRMHKGKYRFVESAADGIPEIKPAGGSNKEYLRETSRGFEYVESETYYLFRKTGARKEPRIARIRNGFHKNKSV